jgi:hypothetical protein
MPASFRAGIAGALFGFILICALVVSASAFICPFDTPQELVVNGLVSSGNGQLAISVGSGIVSSTAQAIQSIDDTAIGDSSYSSSALGIGTIQYMVDLASDQGQGTITSTRTATVSGRMIGQESLVVDYASAPEENATENATSNQTAEKYCLLATSRNVFDITSGEIASIGQIDSLGVPVVGLDHQFAIEGQGSASVRGSYLTMTGTDTPAIIDKYTLTGSVSGKNAQLASMFAYHTGR